MIIKILVFALLVIASYFIGNISVARLISKKKNNDITKLGSGNPGTMNMARNFGWKMGLLTLVLDMVKAIIPCLAGYFLGKYAFAGVFSINTWVYATGLAVILGHMFPIFYKFKGGKGIACALGVFAVTHPIWIAIFLAVGLLILVLTEIGSLTSLTLVTGLSIVGIIYSNHFVEIILIAIIYLLLIVAHRQNLVRLFKGQENKVKLFKKKEK